MAFKQIILVMPSGILQVLFRWLIGIPLTRKLYHNQTYNSCYLVLQSNLPGCKGRAGAEAINRQVYYSYQNYNKINNAYIGRYNYWCQRRVGQVHGYRNGG